MFQYTLDDLRETIQASENELREGLIKLEALEIDGELIWWKFSLSGTKED